MKFVAFGDDEESIIIGLEDAIKKIRQGFKEDYDHSWYLGESNNE